MAKAIIIYDSSTGNTEKMAYAIGEGIKETGVDLEIKKVGIAKLDDLLSADAIILGSPTYFAGMTAKMKKFIDESIKIYPNKLKNKLGAAFTSCGGLGGGNETTLLSLILAMLMHGMVIIGYECDYPFGIVSQEDPDPECLEVCKKFGIRIGNLTKKLF